MDPSLSALARNLSLAKGPNRELDAALAGIFGYHQIIGSGKKSQWRYPGGQVGPLPKFTQLLHAAELIVRSLGSDVAYAVTWQNGIATAVVSEARPVRANTPSNALCLAALMWKLRESRNIQ